MTLKPPKFLRTLLTSFGLVTLSIANQVAMATNYTVTGPAPGVINPGALTPPLSLSTTDTVTVSNGATLATPSNSSVAYTINTSGVTGTTTPVTVDSGGTLSYNGTSTTGAAISSIRSDVIATDSMINLNGNANNGTGLYAIYITNSSVATTNDYYTITNTGTMVGAVVTSGVARAIFNISGPNASVTGTINLAVYPDIGHFSILNIQNGAHFIPTGTISNTSLIAVDGTSSLTLNNTASSIRELSIAAGGTVTINSTLAGIPADGPISNNGTMNIAAGITKTDLFTGTGTNIVSQDVSVSTSNYIITNHTSLFTDILNYGNMTLTNSSTTTITNFSVTGGAGYFPAGTYTLASSPVNITVTNPITKPSSTLFLSFDTPVIDNISTPKNIKMTINRTPFNTYASTTLTNAIAVNLESIGAGNPSSDMVTLLDAIEASTTPSQLESALEQLAPLTTAPIFGIEVQNNTMRQVQLRLAELRDRETYFAGDIAKDNYVWVRPFGGYANQQPKNDSFGYYGSGGGVAAGFDRNLGANYNVGAAAAYALSHVKDKVNMESRTEIKSYIGMVYGSYNFPDTHYFDWIVAVVANNFNAARVVNINGYYQTPTSSYGSQQISFKGLWGKEIPAFGFMQLTPLAAAQYTFAKQYEYTESNGAATNLTISRTNSNLVQLGLGGKAAVPLWVNPSIIVPEIHALAFYNPIIGQQNSEFSFVDGGGQMISIFDLSRTGLIYGGALTIAVVDTLEVKFNIDFNIQDRFNAYVVYMNLRYSI